MCHQFQYWNLAFVTVIICSGFKDLFDWEHFIKTLKDDVAIVETLPDAYANIEPFSKTPISWSKVMIKQSEPLVFRSYCLCVEDISFIYLFFCPGQLL